MRYVIALGGNALLQHNEPLEADILHKNSLIAAKHIAKIADEHQVLLVHGNGPQVGLLALQAESYKQVHPYPFDILVAESQGMIGYILQQALFNHLKCSRVATLLTQVTVDKADEAFNHPSKPIGPFYNQNEINELKRLTSWDFMQINNQYRRIISSPKPLDIVEFNIIQDLLEQHILVIAGGGGGIPCTYDEHKNLVGVEAVIDKDLTASLLATRLDADYLIILTDIDAVYENWNTNEAKPISHTTPRELMRLDFAEGSMKPKIAAACQYVKQTNKRATIGHLNDLEKLLQQQSGTHIYPL